MDGENDLRLLRRLDIAEGETGLGGRVDTVIGIVVSRVYSMDPKPWALGPIIERVTWRERYGQESPSCGPP